MRIFLYTNRLNALSKIITMSDIVMDEKKEDIVIDEKKEDIVIDEKKDDIVIDQKKDIVMNVMNEMKNIFSKMKTACERGESHDLEELLKWEGPNGEKVDPTTPFEYPSRSSEYMDLLQYSAVYGSLGCFCVLLEWEGSGVLQGKRMDPTLNNNNAIRIAVGYPNPDIISQLLRWKGTGYLEGKVVDPTVNDNFCIKLIASNPITEMREAYAVDALLNDERVFNTLTPTLKKRLQNHIPKKYIQKGM
jgi:hypothetical protein